VGASDADPHTRLQQTPEHLCITEFRNPAGCGSASFRILNRDGTTVNDPRRICGQGCSFVSLMEPETGCDPAIQAGRRWLQIAARQSVAQIGEKIRQVLHSRTAAAHEVNGLPR
jgi:hypothetical protein